MRETVSFRRLSESNDFSRFFYLLVTDTDYSESEAFSSLHISGQVKSPPMSPPSHSEGVVMRIETTRAPVPSQPEIVLSDGEFL